MSKKFVNGMILLAIGLILGGIGVYLSAQYLGTGLLYANSFLGKYYFAAPVLVLAGIIFALIGYFKACKNFVKPERKPKEKKEKQPKQAPVAQVANPVPPAPAPEANPSPLEATMISYTFCGKCGRRNKTGAKFCGGCGEKL